LEFELRLFGVSWVVGVCWGVWVCWMVGVRLVVGSVLWAHNDVIWVHGQNYHPHSGDSLVWRLFSLVLGVESFCALGSGQENASGLEFSWV
jgi:hypothetical protein